VSEQYHYAQSIRVSADFDPIGEDAASVATLVYYAQVSEDLALEKGIVFGDITYTLSDVQEDEDGPHRLYTWHAFADPPVM
jgi:hypothetical protein